MMTIAMARLTVRTYLNRLGRLDPEAAQDLTEAIQLIIDDAVERATHPDPPALEGPVGEGVPPAKGGSRPGTGGTPA